MLQQVTQAIGRENLVKVTLTFEGSALDDLAVHVEGPEDLKAKIEEAAIPSAIPTAKPATPPASAGLV